MPITGGIGYNSREEWLNIRKGYIGGSDAAAVVGLDPYKSRYSLWAEKTGRIPGPETTITMRAGTYLEEFVAQLYQEQSGTSVVTVDTILTNSRYPFACANIDRQVEGEDAILEIKTTTSPTVIRMLRGGEYPERWYCQMTHYLAVTGFERAYLAALADCKELFTFTLERDESEIAALMDAEAAFWELVKNDTPPTPDGTDASTEAIAKIYANSQESQMELFGRKSELDEYMALKQQRKAVDERIAEIENIIKTDMGDSERGFSGGYNISWKSQTRRMFQAKDFAKDHPELDLTMYYKASTSRPFKVVAVKEE